MSPPFNYPPLCRLRNEIRLIELHPGSPEDPIQCSIHVRSLDDNPKYDALSYAWGEPGGEAVIQLGRQRFTISTTLRSALQDIRNQSEFRTLWVDTLCIDQLNHVEKKWQVKMMGMIYKKCARGLLWVGEESERSDAWCPAINQSHCDHCVNARGSDHVCSYDACQDQSSTGKHKPTRKDTTRRLSFSSGSHGLTKCKHLNCRWHGRRPTISEVQRLMKALGEDNHLHGIPALSHALQTREKLDFETMEPLMALGALMSRSWWTRMWTVQEAALPPISTLCWGKCTYPLVDMAQSAEKLFFHSQNCCSEFFAKLIQRLDKLSCGEATVNALFNFQKHVHTLDLTRRWIGKPGMDINLMDCLYNFHDRKSKYPRDKIFACLGLLPSSFGLDADYETKQQQLYQEISFRLLHSYPDRSLSVLWRESKPTGPHPSWVKEFDKETTALNRRARSVHYNASNGGSVQVQDHGRGILSFLGTKVDVISDVTENAHSASTYSVSQFSTFREWAKFLKLHECQSGRSTVTWLEDFARTLSGDVHKLRSHYPGLNEEKLKSFVQSLLKKRPRYDLIETSLAQELNTSAAGRKLFTTERGSIGLGPEWMQLGDEVWILSGGSVPFVLRPLPTQIARGDEPGAQRYHVVIGDCYVQGIMFGEAVPTKSSDEYVFLK